MSAEVLGLKTDLRNGGSCMAGSGIGGELQGREGTRAPEWLDRRGKGGSAGL